MQYSVPSVALTEAARELTRLGEASAEMFEQGCQALINKDETLARQVLNREDEFIDPIYKALNSFINTLMQGDLSVDQQNRCFQIKNLLIDIERVGDLSEDLAQFALERIDNDVAFSPQAIQDMEKLSQHVHNTYSLSIQAFRDSDRTLAHKVCRLEHDFDHIYSQTRQKHIERLEAGVCCPEANVIFTEMLRNLERVSDHADNLGVSVQRVNVSQIV
jgi:phosphate:Na+ symporter